MRKATMLFVLGIVGVLSLIGGTAAAAPSPAISHSVDAEFFELNGTVAARVTVVNTDSVAIAVEVSDVFGNQQTFQSVQPGKVGTVVFQTNATVVMGYTVQAVVRANDGRIAAHGHSFGTYDLRPAPAVQVLPPVQHDESAPFDLGRWIAQLGLPTGF